MPCLTATLRQGPLFPPVTFSHYRCFVDEGFLKNQTQRVESATLEPGSRPTRLGRGGAAMVRLGMAAARRRCQRNKRQKKAEERRPPALTSSPQNGEGVRGTWGGADPRSPAAAAARARQAAARAPRRRARRRRSSTAQRPSSPTPGTGRGTASPPTSRPIPRSTSGR